MHRLKIGKIESIFAKIKDKESELSDINIVEYAINFDNGKSYVTNQPIGNSKAGDIVSFILCEKGFNSREECIILTDDNADEILKEDKKSKLMLLFNIAAISIAFITLIINIVSNGLSSDINLSFNFLLANVILLFSRESIKINKLRMDNEEKAYIKNRYCNKEIKIEDINIQSKKESIIIK